MKLNIIEDDYIQNIQNDFHAEYPYLKLVFFKNPHIRGHPSPNKDLLNPDTPIEEVTMFHQSGEIDIAATRSTFEVEEDFFHRFGLCVQVFRQSGKLWLETTKTDGWTLKQQNEKGREEHILIKQESAPDADLKDVN